LKRKRNRADVSLQVDNAEHDRGFTAGYLLHLTCDPCRVSKR